MISCGGLARKLHCMGTECDILTILNHRLNIPSYGKKSIKKSDLDYQGRSFCAEQAGIEVPQAALILPF